MNHLREGPNVLKPKVGRPTKYHPRIVKVICQAIADGVPYKFAASLAGISYETFRDWQRHYPPFSVATQKALARGIQSRLQNMQKFAKRGNVRADQWWLSHVLPEYFAEDRVITNEKAEVLTETRTEAQVMHSMRFLVAHYDKRQAAQSVQNQP